MKSLYIGASVAISWAWGTSLILGMQIAQQKGIEAFLTWATANSLTLAFFGWLYKSRIITERILEYKLVHVMTLVIQCFCLVIQLKILNDVLGPIIGNPFGTYALVSTVGVFFVGLMWKHGLATSILTDNWQGGLTIVALLAMLGVCLATDAPTIALPHSDSSALMWGGWSACILMSGIITDLQHWQRAKANGGGYAFECATGFFAIYMALVFALAHFELTGVNQWLLIAAVLGVTTSTIDSIAVAMHRLCNKHIGTLACFAVCILWGLFVQVGLVDLWSNFGVVRIGLALFMLLMGVLCGSKNFRTEIT